MLEEWRPVFGWEESYEISSLGRIRSLDRLREGTNHGLRKIKGKVLKPALSKKTGYYEICLYSPLIWKYTTVHSLVCEAFHGLKPSPKHEVAHWDGDPTNNKADNLRWATRKENYKDTERHGRTNKGKHNPRSSRLNKDTVLEIRKLLVEGLSKGEVARILSLPVHTIYDVHDGRSWAWLK